MKFHELSKLQKDKLIQYYKNMFKADYCVICNIQDNMYLVVGFSVYPVGKNYSSEKIYNKKCVGCGTDLKQLKKSAIKKLRENKKKISLITTLRNIFSIKY